jgi:hypothetical protein
VLRDKITHQKPDGFRVDRHSAFPPALAVSLEIV